MFSHKASIAGIFGRDIKRSVAKLVICPIFRLLGHEFWKSLIVKEVEKYNWHESHYFADVASDISKGLIRKDMLEKVINVEFESHVFKTFEDYDEILKNYYGDYWTLPPVKQRRGHDMEVYWIEK